MVKCPRCGYENSRNSKYCVNCTFLLKKPENKDEKKGTLNSWKHMNKFRKLAIVLTIFLIFFIACSLIYTISYVSNDKSLNIATSNDSDQKKSSTPYVVNIYYNGSWEATMGSVKNPETFSGDHNYSKRLDCVAWDHIKISVSKTDENNYPLKVKVFRDGQVIFEQTTTDTNGKIFYELNKD